MADPPVPPERVAAVSGLSERLAGGGEGSTFFERMPTGAKLMLILSAALLPLALIAIVATLQTSRIADSDTRARLRIAANESARAVAIELVGDMTALGATVQALTNDPADLASCARAQGVFAPRAADGARFAITDASGRVLCGAVPPGARLAATPSPDGSISAEIVPGRGLFLVSGAPGGRGLQAQAFFPSTFLADLSRPTSRVTPFGTALVQQDQTLALVPIADGRPFTRTVSMRNALGIGDLVLVTTTPAAALTSSFFVSLLLPFFMWAAAAGIVWLVVDRLLIRPLQRLRASVAAFRPGDEIGPDIARMMPAQEIRELGDTFRAISRTVALHEAGLAEGLVRQTKLTREVHHRVKNNLQVISSLINFHARGASSPDAAHAYASIQRRVDALAVVHRHHFAEMEENRGLNIRTMIAELGSNLRATAPEGGARLAITLDVDPLMVNQDVAVAVAFLVTEVVELAMTCDPAAQIRVAVKPEYLPDQGAATGGEKVAERAVLRVVSRALVEDDALRELATRRYGRVMEGLARQLRSKLHHDPLTGAYEIGFVIMGRS